MKQYVMDACAALAALNNELGAERVDALMASDARILMSSVNALEVCYDMARRSGSMTQAKMTLDELLSWPVEMVYQLDEDMLLAATKFKSKNRMSLANAIALGLAQVYGATLITADHHEFDPLEAAGLAEFEWIR